MMSERAGLQVKKKNKRWIFLTGHKSLRLTKLMRQLFNLFISQLYFGERKKKPWHLFGALLFCSSVIYTLQFSLMRNTKMFTGPRGGGHPYWTLT